MGGYGHMKIEYFHASKYGNGAMVAEEFKRQMAARGVMVNVQHVRNARSQEMPPADLYIFSSPGRFGKPIGDMQHFLKKARLTKGMKYAVLATEMAPNPAIANRKPDEEEIGPCQRIIPLISQYLQDKGLIKVAETKIFVTGFKGPLEKDWQKTVDDFISNILAMLEKAV
jgi:hypothetical protein